MSKEKNTRRDSSKEANREKPRNRNDRPKEHGGPGGLEPTRYGDWEKNGRCIDF